MRPDKQKVRVPKESRQGHLVYVNTDDCLFPLPFPPLATAFEAQTFAVP